MSEKAEKEPPSWGGIGITVLASLAQGVACYAFFFYQRKWGKPGTYKDLYEPRQYDWEHRSPPIDKSTPWWKAALNIEEDELLRCVGLDGYMFLRFLRLGLYLCTVGSIISVALIPIYATGANTDDIETQFNRWTLGAVESESNWRLCISVIAWYSFVGATLHALYKEWIRYKHNYTNFLAKGDEDMPKEYRYAVRVEEIPAKYCTDSALHEYFNRLFPDKVLQASVFWETSKWDELIQERQENIEALEHVIAKHHAKPDNARPTVKVDSDGDVGLLTTVTSTMTGGKLVEKDAEDYYRSQLQRLNKEIDEEREKLRREIQIWNEADKEDDDASSNDSLRTSTEKPTENEVTSTAHVTFTSLRSKQAAVQCELNGYREKMVVKQAPDPDGVLWENLGYSRPRQKIFKKQAAAMFTTGILFWAIPIAFVTSVNKLNTILEVFSLPELNPDTTFYAFVSGLLPVIFLAAFMFALYTAIEMVATKLVRYKSMTEVVSYTFFWHQLFQFANLWLIVIGGSLFDQLTKLIESPTEIVDVVAETMPEVASFFINMIIVDTFASPGMELSMIQKYGFKLVKRLYQNKAMLTQRELDQARDPPAMNWGKQVPQVVFIFLVILVYMPIVPIMEVFGIAYFGLNYLVFKHQFLHVYAQDFEGGGKATWQELFPFLMVCLYMAEITFIGYMGIKEAPTESILGIGPLVATIIFHMYLKKAIIAPLQNLPLEVAANIDIDDGELRENDGNTSSYLYGMPVLKTGPEEEREPMPYRRGEEVPDEEVATSKKPQGSSLDGKDVEQPSETKSSEDSGFSNRESSHKDEEASSQQQDASSLVDGSGGRRPSDRSEHEIGHA